MKVGQETSHGLSIDIYHRPLILDDLEIIMGCTLNRTYFLFSRFRMKSNKTYYLPVIKSIQLYTIGEKGEMH